jgi:protein-L-isoaspartate(D-aspartate) O-methyltransferase
VKPNSDEDIFKKLREDMVEMQLVTRNIRDARILDAMRKVPRHLFVPEYLIENAYEDNPLPIGWDQTISQPYIVAYMTEALKLSSEDRVLEIGTGSGYQAAVLAELVKEVFTIEVVNELYELAKDRLLALGYQNIHLRQGDGNEGWPEEAPFDKMIVTAAADHIPRPLVKQLKEGGRLMIPIGHFTQTLILGVKKHEMLQTFETIPVRFVPLVERKEKSKEGKHGEGKKKRG